MKYPYHQKPTGEIALHCPVCGKTTTEYENPSYPSRLRMEDLKYGRRCTEHKLRAGCFEREYNENLKNILLAQGDTGWFSAA
jgi:hypothetical protein